MFKSKLEPINNRLIVFLKNSFILSLIKILKLQKLLKEARPALAGGFFERRKSGALIKDLLKQKKKPAKRQQDLWHKRKQP